MANDWTAILQQTEAYYTARVREYGATAHGVDWNSHESQHLRFQQLLRVVDDPTHPFSINDVGCGYGALADYLQTFQYSFSYLGIDLSAEMIAQARARHKQTPQCHFVLSSSAFPPADYSVASGIFNVKLTTPYAEWHEYMLAVIDQLAESSMRGFAFNVLTKYADAQYMRSDLYYADPEALFTYCRQRFSRWVAILHDYGLYEFTVVVRREGDGVWRNLSSLVRETSLA